MRENKRELPLTCGDLLLIACTKIIGVDRARLGALYHRFGVDCLAIFGLAAYDEIGPDSDVYCFYELEYGAPARLGDSGPVVGFC